MCNFTLRTRYVCIAGDHTYVQRERRRRRTRKRKSEHTPQLKSKRKKHVNEERLRKQERN